MKKPRTTCAFATAAILTGTLWTRTRSGRSSPGQHRHLARPGHGAGSADLFDEQVAVLSSDRTAVDLKSTLPAGPATFSVPSAS